MEHFVYYNSGSGSEGSPTTEKDYHNYLSGKWRDDSQLVWGGNGHSSGGATIPSKYMYPATSDPLFYSTGGTVTNPTNWSESNSGNISGDRRGIGSSGPFTIQPGAVIEIDLALVFGQDFTGSGASGGVTAMQEAIDTVRSNYSRGITANCASGMTTSIDNNSENKSDLMSYPNPFNNVFTINYELENNPVFLEIYNGIGEKIKSQTITQNTTVIDLSNQTNGFYFVTITEGTNRMSRKIMKQ
jgi:hypothetical protein